MFHCKMCSTEVGCGCGVLRVNILLKHRGVSAKIRKNDKYGWKASAKRGEDVKKEGASGLLTRSKPIEEKILKSGDLSCAESFGD